MAYRGKSKYVSYSNKHKHLHKLEPGLTGFLCTCNGKFREKDCLRESYNILNEFADELFGPQIKEDEKVKQKVVDDSVGLEVDIETSLANEIESIKAEEKNRHDTKRFQVVESGANGIVFIKTTVPDPVKLAYAIATSYSKGIQKSKFVFRLLPVEITCKAYLEEISSAIAPLLGKYFSGEEKTFAVVFNHRNNDRLKRDEVIDKLVELVCQRNVLHKVDLKQPQLVILLEVIRSICCISIVPDYYLLKKYNLLENALKGSEGIASKENENCDESASEGNISHEKGENLLEN